MMQVDKRIWTERDFGQLGWHDCRLYSMVNDYNEFNFKLDLDYILKWEKVNNELKGFWVSPCDLIFQNYSFLEINIVNEGTTDTIISNVSMNLIGTTPNGKFNAYQFTIELNGENYISVKATGFKQVLRKNPILLSNQDYGSLENRV